MAANPLVFLGTLATKGSAEVGARGRDAESEAQRHHEHAERQAVIGGSPDGSRCAAACLVTTRQRMTSRAGAEVPAVTQPAADLHHRSHSPRRPVRSDWSVKVPARAVAQVRVDVLAHASDAMPNAAPAPRCCQCEDTEVGLPWARDDAIAWACPA